MNRRENPAKYTKGALDIPCRRATIFLSCISLLHFPFQYFPPPIAASALEQADYGKEDGGKENGTNRRLPRYPQSTNPGENRSP
jgi:hypothetical protein